MIDSGAHEGLVISLSPSLLEAPQAVRCLPLVFVGEEATAQLRPSSPPIHGSWLQQAPNIANECQVALPSAIASWCFT